MEQRKELRGYSIVLIVLGIAELFKFVTSLIIMMKDGSLEAAFAGVDADVLTAVKIVTYVILGLCALLTLADVAIGIKGIKVSKNPTAAKGYIIWAKVFLVLTAIAIISTAVDVFTGNETSKAIDLASATLSVCFYSLFVNAADKVRKSVIAGEQ